MFAWVDFQQSTSRECSSIGAFTLTNGVAVQVFKCVVWMKMKLRVPFLCVALLSVGIMPVSAAGSRSFSEGANSDSAEAAPAIAPIRVQ